MKKKLLLLSIVGAIALQAHTIGDLFDALKKQPQTRLDAMQARFADLSAQSVRDKFYPDATLFATYEHYSSATNLRPVSPIESAKLGHEHKPYPFAQTIERVGSKVTMPIFVKELFDLSKKAKSLAKSAKMKKRLNFLENEAAIAGSDAQWIYLKSLQEALKSRKRSVQKTYDDTKIKVDAGRAPAIALDKMDEAINQLDTSVNQLDIKRAQIVSSIETLTGLRLTAPVPISTDKAIATGDIFALKPLQFVVDAKQHDVDAAYSRLYPKVALSAMWSENYSQHDVRLSEDVHRGYGNYMIGISMPLFEKDNYTDIQKAKIDMQKEQFRLDKVKQELQAKAKELKVSLHLLKHTKELAQKSVQNRKNLLKYAKVAYSAGRMDEEEYLRYEDGLLDAQSKYYEADASSKQVIAQLAVIYGNDLKGVFK